VVDTVALVYRTGGDYSLEYVDRLTKNCIRFGAKRVVCLTDDPDVASICEPIPLKHNWPGWWSKLELFEQLDSALYFDLDTVINGDITHLLEYNHKFTMLKGFSKNNQRGASGVMAWNGDYAYLSENFSEERIPEYTNILKSKWGDQDWINDHIQSPVEYFQQIFPKQIVSRKCNSLVERQNASVICYHGNPRPHNTGWAV